MQNNTKEAYARWATEFEIKSSLYEVNLNGDKQQYSGIPLYASPDSVFVDQTDTHSLIIGSTGSKKTRLIGMPSLRLYANAGESFVATDPKAELYERTLPLLKERGYRVFVLNLRDPLHSNGWNPLSIPYHLYHNGQRDKAIEMVIDMANCIMEHEGFKREPYWSNSAADLLAGLLLILFECAQENEINFMSLRALRTKAFRIIENNIPFIRYYFLKYLDKTSFVFSLLNGTAEVCDETRGCIISTFDQAMRPFFSQDNLIDLLSGNELDMAGIGNEKTAVFLIIPDENTLYHRLVSVFIKQCYTVLINEAQKQPSKMLKRRVNFLLDEFSSLPPISDFPSMITASRSRNIRFNLFVQSFMQLHAKYGIYAEAIKGNCENWIFLHSREFPMLAELINLSGMNYNDFPLTTVSMLQTLDKDKGEAFVLHKRLNPYIARLPDINSYPRVPHEEEQVSYPQHNHKVQSVFDFESFCSDNCDFFLSKLFSGMKLEEIRNISSEEIENYYMSYQNAEPIFSTTLSGEAAS